MATDHELRLRERLARLRNVNLLGGARVSAELEKLERQLARIAEEATDEDIWQSVELARHDDRPYTLDYATRLFDDWVELHGDRVRADDHAIVAGLGRFDGKTVALVGHQKGRDIKDRIDRNFGSAHPEGYLEAFANIYKNFANHIRARLERRKLATDDPALDYPKIEDGVRGMAFIEAVVKSSKKNAAWTKVQA